MLCLLSEAKVAGICQKKLGSHQLYLAGVHYIAKESTDVAQQHDTTRNIPEILRTLKRVGSQFKFKKPQRHAPNSTSLSLSPEHPGIPEFCFIL
ncbi:hypothetical protein HYQ46_012293 [Verticillium longisporum]|nr:hypothetical protein HYQ46_012293 [Verticillium longisporum]